MPRFPEPDGPFAVGAVSWLVTDPNRPSHLLSETPGRQLFLKVWYPAESYQGAPQRLWAALRQRENLPLSLRWLLWRFRNVETATYADAPFFHPSAPARPLVVYSHGLVSFAEENTSLAEMLASHGHTVLAIDHQEQMAELQALNRENPQTGPSGRAAARALKEATPETRARMGAKSVREAANTNRIVAERAADIAHVLGRVEEISRMIPGRHVGDLLANGILALGLSLGGAVATEFAGTDQRVRAAVNMDGGMYGAHVDQLPQIPYLMLYSSLTEGLNDALLPDGAERLTPPDSMHLNYHDISMLMPELRLFGAVGRTNPRQFIIRRNQTILEFLKRHA